MPIRINFLAERLAQQQERRRDPVKRAAMVAALFVAALLAWGAYLQLKVVGVSMSASSSRAKLKQIQPQYQQALVYQAALAQAEGRLDALNRLASRRMRWADFLNALQFAVLDEVQLDEVRVSQNFALVPGKPAVTNSAGKITSAGEPAFSRETVKVVLQARDVSENPGDLIANYQEALRAQPLLMTNDVKVSLANRASKPYLGTDRGDKPYLPFEVECLFAERQHY